MSFVGLLALRVVRGGASDYDAVSGVVFLHAQVLNLQSGHVDQQNGVRSHVLRKC